MRNQLWPALRWWVCALALALPGFAAAQSGSSAFSKEQLDQMTAQIALFPDALLTQVLMASTYPSDVAEAAKWSRANSEQKGDDAVKMVQDKPWDPSVQSLVAFPQVIIMMGEKPDWVRNLGDAFLDQPEDVMDSVQRLRAAAQTAGNLKTNEQVSVTTQTAPPPGAVIEAGAPPPPPQVIVIEQRSPDVIFVPMYNPAVVFGPWMWPSYPPVYIPPPPGFWFSTAVATGIAWGVGIGVRNAVWGNANWWGRSVNINVNNFNNINVNNRISNTNINNQRWSHNVNNRGNTPYRGGNATRDNLQRRADATNRDQYRGRDADRQRAQQSLQNRGVNTDRAALQDVDRSQLQNRAQTADRGQVQNRAQNVDRGQMQDRAGGGGGNRNDAFQGVSNRQAGSEINRGNASRQSMQQAQRPSGGGGDGARPSAGGAGARPSAGGGGARPSGGGGGGARAGGGGGGGGGGRGGGGGGRR